MSGPAVFPGPPASLPRDARSGDELFTGLVVSRPRRAGRDLWIGLRASLTAHAIALTLAIVVPILWPAPWPEHSDYIRALIYNPPPAAAAPLPKGTGLVEKIDRPKPVTPETKPEKPKLTALFEVPKEEPLKPEARAPESEQTGSLAGSDLGIREGMDGGVDGGVAGGMPGGVVGGCVGCTGDGPVLDYDQPAKRVFYTRPQYPADAFVKKIEGTVLLEILIDATGRVAHARVIQSVPLLDAAAIKCVLQWQFSPAMKNGHAVATIAHAPVAFQIY